MNHIIPYLAAIAASICYGGATVLEQVGARRQKDIVAINLNNIVSLLKQLPYFLGIILDLLGWIFFLIAVRKLPLFLCLSFVAFSLVISAILDKYLFKTKIPRNEIFAIISVMFGIIMLGVSAKPTSAKNVNHLFILSIELLVIPLGIIGLSVLKSVKNDYSGIILAAFSGLTFGITGIISRFIQFNSFSIKYLVQLPILVLILYGILGMVFLAAALQRDNINRVNSLLYSAELAIPSILGIIYLGDQVRDELWPIMILGLILVTFGSIAVSMHTERVSV
jgi:hypothetical protein